MFKRAIIINLFLFGITFSLFSLSYQFEPGNYYLLDGRINVRSEPTLTSRTLGQLNANSEIKVIECAFNEQVIDGVSAYWYKIEYNSSFGYIWGGYIAVKTFVHDIDSNGQNDYFHYRISKVENGLNIIHKNNDSFIYINGRHIRSNFVSDVNSTPQNLTLFNDCDMLLWEGAAGRTDGSVMFYFMILDYHHSDVAMRGPSVARIGFRVDRFGNITASNSNWYHNYWASRQ
jgi:hypothetical protein